MTKQTAPRPEDSPHFGFELTAGEVAMFAKIERDQAVHNALGAALGAYKDSIQVDRDIFVTELCRKYNIVNPSKVTFDARTRRFVSIFSPDLVALKIDSSPRALKETASALTIASIRELLAIYKAAHEARAAERT